MNSKVLKLDVFNDLKLSNPASEYIDMLSCCSLNHKYLVQKIGNESVIFTKNNKTKGLRDRITFYDKELEMIKNKTLLERVYMGYFERTLRVESNHTTFSQIKRNLGIKDNKLIDVLTTKEPVNYNLVTEIVGKIENTLLLDSSCSLNKIEKVLGRERIIKDCRYDMNKIANFIKKHLGKNSNPSKYLKEYKELKNTMIKGQKIKVNMLEELLSMTKISNFEN